jgi:hypothetical protein
MRRNTTISKIRRRARARCCCGSTRRWISAWAAIAAELIGDGDGAEAGMLTRASSSSSTKSGSISTSPNAAAALFRQGRIFDTEAASKERDLLCVALPSTRLRLGLRCVLGGLRGVWGVRGGGGGGGGGDGRGDRDGDDSDGVGGRAAAGGDGESETASESLRRWVRWVVGGVFEYSGVLAIY